MTCCKEAEKVNFFAARKNIRKMKMKAPVLCSGILNNYHCGLSVLEVCVCVGVCVCVWCVYFSSFIVFTNAFASNEIEYLLQ